MASSSNPDQDSIHLHILVTESQLDPHSQDPVHWKSQFIWLQHLSEVHIKLSPLVHDFPLEYVAIHWLPLHQSLLHCPLYLHPSRGSSRKLKHQSSKVPSKPILEQHLKSLSAYCPHLSELHCVLSSPGRDTPLASLALHLLPLHQPLLHCPSFLQPVPLPYTIHIYLRRSS